MGGWGRRSLVAGFAALAMALGSCVAVPLVPSGYSWFETPRPEDPWRRTIQAWQDRAHPQGRTQPAQTLRGAGKETRPATISARPRLRRASRPAQSAGPQLQPSTAGSDHEPPGLARAYQAFQREERLRTAAEVTTWIQGQARRYFVPDPGVDVWPTVDEVLEAGGDDCDGLAFLTHRLLRELGFADDALFLAIVRRPEDDLHHMVNLWFDDREDPWVIDPTGAMTRGLVRMSQVHGWEPLALFTETAQFRARPQVGAGPAAAPHHYQPSR